MKPGAMALQVDQDIDFAEISNDSLHGGFHLFLVGYIESEGSGLATGSGDFCGQFVQLFLIARGGGDSCAFFGEAEGDGASNTLRGAGHQGYAS
jgi:hypothetical protein